MYTGWPGENSPACVIEFTHLGKYVSVCCTKKKQNCFNHERSSNSNHPRSLQCQSSPSVSLKAYRPRYRAYTHLYRQILICMLLKRCFEFTIPRISSKIRNQSEPEWHSLVSCSCHQKRQRNGRVVVVYAYTNGKPIRRIYRRYVAYIAYSAFCHPEGHSELCISSTGTRGVTLFQKVGVPIFGGVEGVGRGGVWGGGYSRGLIFHYLLSKRRILVGTWCIFWRTNFEVVVCCAYAARLCDRFCQFFSDRLQFMGRLSPFGPW